MTVTFTPDAARAMLAQARAAVPASPTRTAAAYRPAPTTVHAPEAGASLAFTESVRSAAENARRTARSLTFTTQAITALARKAGVQPADIEKELDQGKSLTQIAAEHGISRDDLVLAVAYEIDSGSGLLQRFGAGPLAALAARVVNSAHEAIVAPADHL